MQTYKEKTFDTPDRMDFVHAYYLLHRLRDLYHENHMDDLADAFDVLFHWIDDISLLIGEPVDRKEMLT